MKIRCPLCGKCSQVDVELELGQRVACPWCGEKFEYRGKNWLAALRMPKESIDYVKAHKVFFIALAVIWGCFSLRVGFGGFMVGVLLAVLGMLSFLLLFPLWLYLWRIHTQAVEVICGGLNCLGENKFTGLAKFWIRILTASIGLVSFGLPLLFEMIVVVICARTQYSDSSRDGCA